MIVQDVLNRYIVAGQNTLSESDSKKIIAEYDISVTKEKTVDSLDKAIEAAEEIGFPIVMKGSGAGFTHKSELGLVRVGIRDIDEIRHHFTELLNIMKGRGQVLVQQMVSGEREFLLGAKRDAQFGPVVMFGLGGVFAEVFNDVSMRVAPISNFDAEQMINEISASSLLGNFRGMGEVNADKLINNLIALGNLCLEHDHIAEVDINPLIIENGEAIAVDALIVLAIDK